MNRSLFLLLFITSYSAESIDSLAGNCYEDICCTIPWIGNAFYVAASQIGRNDFLYLAGVDSAWFLRKKIEHQENIENLDKYYLRSGMVFGANRILLYHTPLHEAIREGSIQSVKILCEAGADIHKKVKSQHEILDDECSTEQYLQVFGHITENLKEEATKYRSWCCIGLSALELAEHMIKDNTDNMDDTSIRESRKDILNFLNRQASANK